MFNNHGVHCTGNRYAVMLSRKCRKWKC